MGSFEPICGIFCQQFIEIFWLINVYQVTCACNFEDLILPEGNLNPIEIVREYDLLVFSKHNQCRYPRLIQERQLISKLISENAVGQ
jgi:hypothetical protein